MISVGARRNPNACAIHHTTPATPATHSDGHSIPARAQPAASRLLTTAVTCREDKRRCVEGVRPPYGWGNAVFSRRLYLLCSVGA